MGAPESPPPALRGTPPLPALPRGRAVPAPPPSPLPRPVKCRRGPAAAAAPHRPHRVPEPAARRGAAPRPARVSLGFRGHRRPCREGEQRRRVRRVRVSPVPVPIPVPIPIPVLVPIPAVRSAERSRGDRQPPRGLFLGAGLAGRGAAILGVRSRKQSREEGKSIIFAPKDFSSRLWAGAFLTPGRTGLAPAAVPGCVRWDSRGTAPARSLGAVCVRDVNSSALSGWLRLPALLTFCLAVGQVPAYTTEDLLAENDRVWHTWARCTEQQELEILQNDKLRSVP